MSLREHTRRTFLTLGGAVGLTSLAGCTGAFADEDSPTESESTSEPDTDTDTATATESPTATPTPGLRTVFHFAGEPAAQNHALANVENLLGDDSVTMASVVVVVNGKGLLLATEESEYPERVASLVDRGVSFRACQNSMDALDVDEADLLPGVETVPAGVGELSRLQADGFGYIRTP
jgi:intracellular sulfur oxidation DsrE/DsrF family protein